MRLWSIYAPVAHTACCARYTRIMSPPHRARRACPPPQEYAGLTSPAVFCRFTRLWRGGILPAPMTGSVLDAERSRSAPRRLVIHKGGPARAAAPGFPPHQPYLKRIWTLTYYYSTIWQKEDTDLGGNVGFPG